MARNRSILSKRRKKIKAFDIDITSLLDIITILLIFLIRNYNSSGIEFNIPRDIELPKSQSLTVNNAGISVQVSKDKIWVDDKEVLSALTPTEQMYDQGGRRIIPLYNELVQKKEQIKLTKKTVPEANNFSGVINLIVDKSVKYNYLKKLMYTFTIAGYKEIKFVVMGAEN